jgi:hypothetical protein
LHKAANFGILLLMAGKVGAFFLVLSEYHSKLDTGPALTNGA